MVIFILGYVFGTVITILCYKSYLNHEIEATEQEHKHKFNIKLGRYYKWDRTQYTNSFDHVIVYSRMQCSECGYIKDFILSKNNFLPSMYNSDRDIKDFINKLREQGIVEKYEIEIKLGGV